MQKEKVFVLISMTYFWNLYEFCAQMKIGKFKLKEKAEYDQLWRKIKSSYNVLLFFDQF